MRHIRVIQFLGYSVIVESTVKGLSVGDVLTDNTVIDLSAVRVPVLLQSQHEVV